MDFLVTICKFSNLIIEMLSNTVVVLLFISTAVELDTVPAEAVEFYTGPAAL